MIERIVYWLQYAYAEAYNALIQGITHHSGSVWQTRIALDELILQAQSLALVALPAVVLLVYVAARRRGFAERYGASAARGWAITIVTYALGWTALVLFVMEEEAARGAWTAATLTPIFLWPIGLMALAAAIYGTLALHWIAVRLLPRV